MKLVDYIIWGSNRGRTLSLIADNVKMVTTDRSKLNYGNKHTMATKPLYTGIWSKSNYKNDLTPCYGFHRIEIIKQFKLNRSVVTIYTLPATNLNVRPRFEPKKDHFQSFIHFWALKVKKFQAQQFEPLWTRIRFF